MQLLWFSSGRDAKEMPCRICFWASCSESAFPSERHRGLLAAMMIWITCCMIIVLAVHMALFASWHFRLSGKQSHRQRKRRLKCGSFLPSQWRRAWNNRYHVLKCVPCVLCSWSICHLCLCLSSHPICMQMVARMPGRMPCSVSVQIICVLSAG